MKQDNRKYIFVGNRFFVLEQMLNLKLEVTHIFVVKDSFLEKELVKRGILFETLPPKDDFVQVLLQIEYDVLVSNGCPYILPISRLSDGQRKFINLHPSLLPDLKGKSPINGALLFERKHGVTCHIMDDGIDTGRIIERIEIPISAEINLDLLYQISFRAEGLAFWNSYKKDFFPIGTISIVDDTNYIYYSKKTEDKVIHRDDTLLSMKRKVRAFSSFGQYAQIYHNGIFFDVVALEIIDNPIADLIFPKQKENQILCVYGKKFVLVCYENELCQFTLGNTNGLIENSTFIDDTINMTGGGATSRNKYLLSPVYSAIQKEYAMRVCDTAFARSVLGREDYLSLFRKIDCLADFCVAYTDDIIGYAVLYANNLQDKTAYITLIAVREDSQRNGAGCSLLTWCETTARSRGMKLLRLEVDKDNSKARKFYEKHGFYYEEEQKKDSLYMRKSLEVIDERKNYISSTH